MTEEETKFAVYVVGAGEYTGTPCVCTVREWQELESSQPGVHRLVMENVSESQAEQLARSAGELEGPSRKRLQRTSGDVGYAWLGATPHPH